MLQDPPRGQFSGESFRDHVQQGPCMDSVDLVTSILWYKRYIYIVLYIYIYIHILYFYDVFCIYIYTFTHTSCVGILYHLFIITHIYIYNTYTKFFFAVYPRFAMNNPPCCRPAATRPLPRRRGGCKRLVACRRRGR